MGKNQCMYTSRIFPHTHLSTHFKLVGQRQLNVRVQIPKYANFFRDSLEDRFVNDIVLVVLGEKFRAGGVGQDVHVAFIGAH